MPCLNEEKTLQACIDNAKELFENLGLFGEVIVADNGSRDSSVKIAQELGAKVVHVKEKGYGLAIKGGLDSAQGTYLIIGDSDNSYDFREAAQMIEGLISNACDFAIGTRTKGVIHNKAMPWLHRYVGTPFLGFLLNTCNNTSFSDINCGLRAFSRQCYDQLHLRATGMELASEMLITVSQKNVRIKEYPITLHLDGRDRNSHLRPIRDGLRHASLILRYKAYALSGGKGL